MRRLPFPSPLGSRVAYFVLFCAVLGTSGVTFSWRAAAHGVPAQADDKTPFGQRFKILVSPGTPADALAYYKNVVTKDTGFPTTPPPSLDDLLRYFGYSLKAEDLESKDSDLIMKDFPGEEVLVVRFFAPKITDVSGQSKQGFGWRKLVRLKALDASEAVKHELKSMYLLFNVFSKDLTNPFKKADGGANHSVNNQVILVPKPGAKLPQTAYWMTFGGFDVPKPAERGKLITYLDATFDAADPNLTQGTSRYYVPIACAVCHGGRKPPLLNFLDTDHWLDRIHDDDFDAVGKKQAVLFDAGTNDTTKPEFKKAFGVFRKLNGEILEQNKAADPAGKTFQFLAATGWVDGHKTSADHLTLFERSITATGSSKWSAADPVDKKLLPLLNRYCYRCHSSVKYHIYDKSAVLDLSVEMIRRIKITPYDPKESMPQDRKLSPSVKDELLDLLCKVHS